jgi:hypothetical protein
MYGIRKDLETLDVTNWEDRVQDRDYWRTVTVAAKIFKELKSQEGEDSLCKLTKLF